MPQSATSRDVALLERPIDRVVAVDVVRGAAIVLMSLDHVREFLQSEQYDPLDLSQAGAWLFLTRWVTHFCAPVFVFLAGLSAALSLQAGRGKGDLARHLIVRGLWLVLLELTLVRFGWFFNINYEFTVAQVIWAIGWSLVLLAPATFLPIRAVGILGVAIISLHNVFDGIDPSRFGDARWLWTVLFAPGPIAVPHFSLFVAYPIVPWAGIMFAGFGAGELYRLPGPARRNLLVVLGCLLTISFIALRAANGYGDSLPWSPQLTPLRTALSFVNCQKYPPSLLFTLMTLGPALVLLGLCERPPGRCSRFLITFGRVPLFFYLLHLPVIHTVALAVTFFQHGELPPWLFSFPPGRAGPNGGVSLPAIYALWAAVVALHYPLCRGYWQLKRRRPTSLLRYL